MRINLLTHVQMEQHAASDSLTEVCQNLSQYKN